MLPIIGCQRPLCYHLQYLSSSDLPSAYLGPTLSDLRQAHLLSRKVSDGTALHDNVWRIEAFKMICISSDGITISIVLVVPSVIITVSVREGLGQEISIKDLPPPSPPVVL